MRVFFDSAAAVVFFEENNLDPVMRDGVFCLALSKSFVEPQVPREGGSSE
jgi:hypothetical protein